MITDDKRLIKCLTLRHGRPIATDFKWQTYPGDLNVICQHYPNRFLFTARGNCSLGGSTCIRDRIVSYDFETNENEHCFIDSQDMSIYGHDDILLRNVYQRIPNTSRWSKMWLFGDIKKMSSSIIEPQELRHLPSVYLPCTGEETGKLIYFYALPSSEQFVNDVAVVPLDPKVDSLTSYNVVRCSSDAHYGYPNGRLINNSNHKRFQQSLYVKNDVFYCLDFNRNYLATGLWILRFIKGTNLNPKWEKICFVNPIQLTNNRPFRLIVNDEGEILIIESEEKCTHSNDRSNITIVLCGRLKVPSLKHLTSQIVIDLNPNLLSMNETEQRSNGIPYGCIPSCPWMKNFSKPMITED